MFVSLFVLVGLTAFWMVAWVGAVDRDEKRRRTHVITELPRMSAIPAATRKGTR
jgi:hypothetical protein